MPSSSLPSSSSRSSPSAMNMNMNMKMEMNMKMNYPRNENGDYVKHIEGLEYYSNFLTAIEQKNMLDLIYNNTFQEGIIARRQQFYGEMYYHTAFKSKLLQGACASASSPSCDDENGKDDNDKDKDNDNNKGNDNKNDDCNDDNSKSKDTTTTAGGHFPLDENSNIMKWLDKTMPYFEKELGPTIEKPTQVLINEYKNNMGIASHFEDVQAFGSMICTISLIAPIYMTLKKPTVTAGSEASSTNSNAGDVYEDVVKILLEPGSLLIMKSDARYKYRHGIGKYKWITIPAPESPESRVESPGVDNDNENDDETDDDENENDDNDQNKNADQSSSPTTLPSKDDNNDGTTSTDTNTNTNTNTNNSNNNTSSNNVRSIRRIKRDESYRRVSVTIRHLLSTRRKVYHEHDDESNTIKDPNVY